ncbi:MAG TPA: hypothetical protein VGL75_13485, partial [Acidothermaceae bacterium]
CFAARDWVAMAEILGNDSSSDDRRRVVNAGIRRGRDTFIADMRAVAEVGTADNTTSTVLATRGERLTLNRIHSSALQTELLNVVELNADERTIASVVVFDIEDIDAAFEELDARYLAGEAAAHAGTWTVVARAYAALNRRELPQTTSDWVDIDRRRIVTIEAGGMKEYLRSMFDATSRVSVHIKVVHRLSNSGAVVTHESHATSQEGLDAEWQDISLLTVDGDLINRCEVFDETDLDTALARFDQLSPPAPRLENAATRVFERLYSCIASRDWDAVAQITAENVSLDDRRRVVNAGVVHGRDAAIEGTQATVDVGFTMTMLGAMAIRGERLALTRVRVSGPDPEANQNDALNIVEIDADDRIVADVVFDIEYVGAAIAELDARYLAGEAAAHSRTWSLVTGAFAAINRHELPELTPDWVNIDHRHGATFAPGDMTAFVHDLFEDAPDIDVYVEAVHRLNNLGVVVTHRAHGTSRQGFEAEWREIGIFMFDGDLLSRCELFDEADLAAALARFEQLSRPLARLENAASRVYERFMATFAARDWDAMAQLLANDTSTDDRRRVVNSGIQDGREANIATMRAFADLGVMNMTSEVIATRGECLALSRVGSAAFQTYVLNIVEIDADELIVAVVGLDVGDIDAAFAELDARYLAGEA